MKSLNEHDIVRKLQGDRIEHVNKGHFVHYDGKKYSLDQIFEWAINGVTGSRVRLATLYFDGEKTLHDKEFAVNILQNELKSIKGLPPEIQFVLATYYHYFGKFSEAKSLFESLEGQGFGPAISRLAMMYKNGQGVDVDISIFEDKIKTATKMGHVRSRGLLGVHYMRNRKIKTKFLGLLLFIINIPYAMYFTFFDRKNIHQQA